MKNEKKPAGNGGPSRQIRVVVRIESERLAETTVLVLTEEQAEQFEEIFDAFRESI